MKKSALILALALVFPGMTFALDLDYSTYLGGRQDDYGYAIAVDQVKAVYVAGSTASDNFPVANPYQSSYNDTGGLFTDAFVTKFAPGGSTLIYSTYLGGDDKDGAVSGALPKLGLALDSTGCAYISGMTDSADFPTVNAYQPSHPSLGWSSAFVTKLSSTGTSLVYSTFVGGNSNDYGVDIDIDSSHCAYIIGYTNSSRFPTINAYQSSHGGGNDDAFVTKLSSTGSELIYSTYLGGDGSYDRGYGIAVDSAGSSYVTGVIYASDFPTVNPYQPTHGGGYSDAFLTKFAPSGTSLIYSTFLGGGSFDVGYDVAVGSDNNAYLTGETVSNNFPVVNPYQATRNNQDDIFVTRFVSAGSSLVFSTYIGGDAWERGRSITVDTATFVYIAGDTNSEDFPLVDPYQAELNQGAVVSYSDAYALKLGCTGACVVYSTYLGGDNDDAAYSIAIDSDNSAYITGKTESADFPLHSAYQTEFNPGTSVEYVDAFMAIFGFTPPRLIIENGDYDGDGTSDVAVFRESSGMWSVRGVTRAYFGTMYDIPVAGDYNGDGTSDIGIFRPSTSLWAIRDISRVFLGTSSDVPVPDDYNGDGVCDIAVFRGSTGLWAIRNLPRVYLGASGDIPLPGDYDGDGTSDVALFRGVSGLWVMKDISRFYMGTRGDQASPADYNGDGTDEAAVFRPHSGLWAVNGVTRLYYGSCSSKAIPADYNGDGVDDVAVFRGSGGLWAIRDLSRIYFGSNVDQPVTR